jgi:hypothetical protein
METKIQNKVYDLISRSAPLLKETIKYLEDVNVKITVPIDIALDSLSEDQKLILYKRLIEVQRLNK